MGEELEPVSVDNSFMELAQVGERAVAGGKCGVEGGLCKMCAMQCVNLLLELPMKERKGDAPEMRGTIIAVKTLRRKKKTESRASEV